MTVSPSLNKRLDRVVRKHQRIKKNGVVHRVGADGLIRSRPRLIRPAVPIKGAVIVVLLFIAFKALLFAQMGAGTYALRVENLRNGNFVEQAGAVLMQEEPLTIMLGGYLNQYVFKR